MNDLSSNSITCTAPAQHNTTQHAWTTMNIERAKNVLNIPKQTIQPNVDNFNKNFCTLCKKQIALCERAKRKANRKRRKQWSQVIGIAHLFCEVQKLIDREWLRPQKFKVSTWDRSFSENNFLSTLLFIDWYYYFKTIWCAANFSRSWVFACPFAAETMLLDGSPSIAFVRPSKLIMSCHRSMSGICVPLHILTHCILFSLWQFITVNGLCVYTPVRPSHQQSLNLKTMKYN